MSAQPPLMMLCMVLHGIIFHAVGARRRRQRGILRSCVKNVGKLKLPVLQSKSYSFVNSHVLALIVIVPLSHVSYEALCL